MRLRWKDITSEKRIPNYNKAQNWANLRSEVESDYYRIINSASFRRLQDKTQVFPLDTSDFVRTRLTHSLEVASIAKLIGKQVIAKIVENNLESEKINVHNVVETLNCAALLHDIGNPPFGHFGESSIREWYRKNLSRMTYNGKAITSILTPQQCLDFYNYEGNAQSLRIVGKLHRLKGKHGMHLTSGVLDTIIKYPSNSIEKVHEDKKEERSLFYKKVGYYQSETSLFNKIKENTGTKGCRNPLTFILEAADDLAYTFADLEDGYKKGMYTYDELHYAIETSKDEKGLAILEKNLEEAKKHEHLETIDYDPYKQAIFSWLTAKQLYSISCVSDAFVAHYEEIMCGEFKEELIVCCSEGNLIRTLKKFAYKNVYLDSSILRVEIMGNEILTFFLKQFSEALLHYDSSVYKINEIQSKYIALLSNNYLENYHDECAKLNDEEKVYYRLLLASDYIAGMTDTFAKTLYQQLRGMNV